MFKFLQMYKKNKLLRKNKYLNYQNKEFFHVLKILEKEKLKRMKKMLLNKKIIKIHNLLFNFNVKID